MTTTVKDQLSCRIDNPVEVAGEWSCVARSQVFTVVANKEKNGWIEARDVLGKLDSHPPVTEILQ